MIHIDVFVAGTGKRYEFKCDEKKMTGEIIDRIYKVILKKEHIEMKVTGVQPREQRDNRLASRFWLCCVEQEGVLDNSITLEENGIKNGYRLILV